MEQSGVHDKIYIFEVSQLEPFHSSIPYVLKQ